MIYPYFCTANSYITKYFEPMTTAQIGALNAEILRNLGVVAEDEGALRRVAKYLRRVVREMTDDPTCMSREEFFRRIDEANQGPTNTMLPNENLTAFLKRQGYDL